MWNTYMDFKSTKTEISVLAKSEIQAESFLLMRYLKLGTLKNNVIRQKHCIWAPLNNGNRGKTLFIECCLVQCIVVV